MRIVKKSLKNDKTAKTISSMFDECVREFPNKLLVDKIELRISSVDALILEEGKAIISVNVLDHYFQEEDEKCTRSIFYEYLNRIFIRKSLQPLPQLIEDIMVSRETAKLLNDDYLYYLTLKVTGTKPKSFDEYMNVNVPWVAFFPVDNVAADILYDTTKNKRYEAKAKSLFEVLKKNLWLDQNLDKAVKKLKRMKNAGSKV